MRGLFVTGTDTGVGKTVVAAAIAAALRAGGARVAAYKPVVTGLDEPAEAGWPRDHELLAAAAGIRPEAVAPRTFGPPVSPHLAAELAGTALDPRRRWSRPRAPRSRSAGRGARGRGRRRPARAADARTRRCATSPRRSAAARDRRPAGLGTINHTLLTLEAARAAGLRVAAVVLTPWPAAPSVMEESNRATIARLGRVEVATLPLLPDGSPAALAAGGAALPVAAWLG